jgi:hypothetical protein
LLPSTREWRHRTHVYKFGVLWFWKCYSSNCMGGRARNQLAAFARAWTHTSLGGYVRVPEYPELPDGCT